MRLLTLLLSLLIWCFSAFAQSTPTADCYISATLSASRTTITYDNRTHQCVAWRTSYYTTGGWVALTTAVQGAPDSAGSPGTWVSYSGSQVTEGTNPMTDLERDTNVVKGVFYPWVRIALTPAPTPSGASSRVFVVAYGYSGTSASAANSTLTPPVTFTDLLASPPNPSAGNTSWYTKGGALCSLSPAGVETCTGSGGGTPAQSDVTLSRAWNTVYQNSTTKLMIINVIQDCSNGGTMYFFTDAANPPTLEIAEQGAANNRVMASFPVLPGNFYKGTNDGSPTCSIKKWIETTL